MEYTKEQIKGVLTSKGYKWFDDHNNKGYDVNIVGIRNSTTDGKVTNHFDDTITISYKDADSDWNFQQWPATTDPFMEICRTAKNIWGNTFTYTLIESKDFA